MLKKTLKYIDTIVDGKIISIDHNFGGTPLPFIYEDLENGDRRFISLYDSRIMEVVSKGNNVTQVIFHSDFRGFIELILFDGSYVTLKEKLNDLEYKLQNLYIEIKQLTSKTQWRNMNDLVDLRLNNHQTELDSLKQEVSSLRQIIQEL